MNQDFSKAQSYSNEVYRKYLISKMNLKILQYQKSQTSYRNQIVLPVWENILFLNENASERELKRIKTLRRIAKIKKKDSYRHAEEKSKIKSIMQYYMKKGKTYTTR